IKSVIYSLAPSIISAFTPIIAQKYFNNNMTDINLYRYVYPPLAIIGIFLSIIVFVNTREKLILAKTHIVKVKFFDALKAVAKNKYFWIISLAGWLGFLETFYANVLFWLYQYQEACSGNQYGLIVTIYGNGSLWGMLFAPWAIKRFGKKKVLVVTNLFNILFISCLYPSLSNIWIVLIFLYCNSIVGAFAHVLDPAIQGDIRDYQQYISGERIDGMFSAVGLVGSVVSMVTSSVLPMVYKNHGIFAGNGYKNPYDILYEANVFQSLMTSLILFSVLGAVMNVIPYFFYDLTETKQKGIVKILKIRAFFTDYLNGIHDEQGFNEVKEIIVNSKELALQPSQTIDSNLKKAGRKAYRQAIENNSEIEIARLVVDEIEKFSTPVFAAQLADAKEVFNMGLQGFAIVDNSALDAAKALPDTTPEEKAIKKQTIALIKARLKSKKGISKHYSGGFDEFDDSVFTGLFEQEDTKEVEIDELYKNFYAAKDSKNKEEAARIKEAIKNIKLERNLITHEINEKVNESSKFYRIAKPFLDSKRVIEQSEGYALIDELFYKSQSI
ncbi:MAG TPA: MFS transporter, partial [Clostridia bacterium]|nr:MFS transporter [Clostridia bacterium]